MFHGDFYAAAEIADTMDSKCRHCGAPLGGVAVALCDECLEENFKETKDACEREIEYYD